MAAPGEAVAAAVAVAAAMAEEVAAAVGALAEMAMGEAVVADVQKLAQQPMLAADHTLGLLWRLAARLAQM